MSNPYYLNPKPPSYSTVGVISSQIVAENTQRRGLVLTNDSANKIYLAFCDNDAVVGSGIVLPAGGIYVMATNDLYCNCKINAIATDAGSNVAIQEYE